MMFIGQAKALHLHTGAVSATLRWEMRVYALRLLEAHPRGHLAGTEKVCFTCSTVTEVLILFVYLLRYKCA